MILENGGLNYHGNVFWSPTAFQFSTTNRILSGWHQLKFGHTRVSCHYRKLFFYHTISYFVFLFIYRQCRIHLRFYCFIEYLTEFMVIGRVWPFLVQHVNEPCKFVSKVGAPSQSVHRAPACAHPTLGLQYVLLA